jgi:hypothetical protein
MSKERIMNAKEYRPNYSVQRVKIRSGFSFNEINLKIAFNARQEATFG